MDIRERLEAAKKRSTRLGAEPRKTDAVDWDENPLKRCEQVVNSGGSVILSLSAYPPPPKKKLIRFVSAGGMCVRGKLKEKPKVEAERGAIFFKGREFDHPCTKNTPCVQQHVRCHG